MTSCGPPVADRIHARKAEYTHAKMLLRDLSNALEIMWWHRFGSKTYRAIDREIRQLEKLDTFDDEQRQLFALALRRYYLLNVIRDLHELPSNSGRRAHRLLEWSNSEDGTRLVVREISGARVKILVERHIVVEPRTFGETTVPWMNEEAVIRTVSDLLSTYFPMRKVLSLRPARLLRTRRDPKGWPLTILGIQRLYDYLVPFYRARSYRRRGRLSAGHYPTQLIRDITEICRLELVTARGLKEADVRGVIQRYLLRLKDQHRLKRPLGPEMFMLVLPKRRRKGMPRASSRRSNRAVPLIANVRQLRRR